MGCSTGRGQSPGECWWSPVRRGDALLAGAARRVLTAVEDAAGAAPLAAAAGDPPFAVTHGLYWLAVNASEAGPVLVAIDDLHWADQASLRFVLYLADRLAGLPVACQGGGDLGRWGRRCGTPPPWPGPILRTLRRLRTG